MEGQTTGHELTHTLCYWAGGTPIENANSFLSEGIAVHFDESNRDNMALAKSNIPSGSSYKSVKGLWQSPERLNDSMYLVAGAFVDYLFNQCTTDQLRNIFHDQSYAHFTDVVGQATAEAIIRHFDEQVLSKN